MPVPLATENIWFNKAQCDDAERLYYEKLAGAKPVSYRNPANGERTFIMLKPDAIHRGLVGVVMDRFESRGFKLLACKFMKASQDLLKEHYADLAKKGFFSELIRYMSSGPLVPMVWEGLNAVKQGRMMLGATNPQDSDPGTIRGDFCVDVGRNLIHGSDSLAAAEKEIALWFRPEEVAAWRSATVTWVYEEEEEETEKGAAGDDSSAPKGLSAQIAKARQHIKNSLECVDGLVALAGGEETNLVNKLNALDIENKQLKKVTDDLKALVLKLEARVAVLEKGGKAEPAKPAPAEPAPAKPAKEEEEDDEEVDLFGSDDDDEEEDAEKARVTAERLKAYHEKKSKKPALVAKTSVLFDVKPWDDETDMNEMLKACKSIEMEGLVWGASKLVPVGYGINKLQLMCVVEDDKVSIEELSEKMAEFEDFIQSVDVAVMSKI